MKSWYLLLTGLCLSTSLSAQDTFSIVAVDENTGEVGSAGASCVDLIGIGYPADFLGDLIPGVGAINTQSFYEAGNQDNARTRMLAGDTPSEIMTWLDANDIQNNPQSRQYGAAMIVNGQAQAASYTGTTCLDWKGHREGVSYAIQGNILLGQQVIDSMEARFLAEPGDLRCKLMAALQGAKMVGADTRCTNNGTSSLFAFIKVAQPTDTYGQPSFKLGVKTPDGDGIEPIESLQTLFNQQASCGSTGWQEWSPEIPYLVYPNPFEGVLEVTARQKISEGAQASLLDAEGRVVAVEPLQAAQANLRTGHLSPGFYVLQISSEEGWYRQKVIKQ